MDVFFADTGMEALVFDSPIGRFQKGYLAYGAHVHPHATPTLIDGSAARERPPPRGTRRQDVSA